MLLRLIRFHDTHDQALRFGFSFIPIISLDSKAFISPPSFPFCLHTSALPRAHASCRQFRRFLLVAPFILTFLAFLWRSVSFSFLNSFAMHHFPLIMKSSYLAII